MDEDVDFLKEAAMILREAGFEVGMSNEVKQSKRLVQEFSPDLLILELEMHYPVNRILDELKAVPKLCRMPYLFLSGNIGVQIERDQLYDFKNYSILSKPFGMRELIDQIKKTFAYTI